MTYYIFGDLRPEAPVGGVLEDIVRTLVLTLGGSGELGGNFPQGSSDLWVTETGEGAWKEASS